ncbi:MAG: hypothetical protein ACR2PX_21795 [Endozoicomonas sp.]|uniref:hypothetical protein n=1 Tax=Endozoicomonas sp. TaxID=1892382 RepID=UPI003D9AC4FC
MRLINRSILFLFLGMSTLSFALGESSEKEPSNDYFLCHSQNQNPLKSYWYLTTATYQGRELTGFRSTHKMSKVVARYLKAYFHHNILCSPIGNRLHSMDISAEATHELIPVPIVTTDDAHTTISTKIVSPELLKIAFESGIHGPSPFKKITSTSSPVPMATSGADHLFKTSNVLMFGVSAFILANTIGPDWAPILAAGITASIIGFNKLMRFSSVWEHPYPVRLAKVHVSKQVLKGVLSIGLTHSVYDLPKIIKDTTRFDKLLKVHIFNNIVSGLTLDEQNRIKDRVSDALWHAIGSVSISVEPKPGQRVVEQFYQVEDEADNTLLALFHTQYPAFEKYTTYAMYYHYFKTFVLYTMGKNTWRAFQAMIPQYLFNEAFELATGKPIESAIGFYDYDSKQSFFSQNNLLNDIEDFMLRNWITTLSLSYHFLYLKHRQPALQQFGSTP